MASAIGLRQALPTHTKSTWVRLDREIPPGGFFSFFTKKILRRLLVALRQLLLGGESIHAPLCRQLVRDETLRPKCFRAVPAPVCRRILRGLSRLVLLAR